MSLLQVGGTYTESFGQLGVFAVFLEEYCSARGFCDSQNLTQTIFSGGAGAVPFET
jgi:hypothetical protein